VAILLRDGDAIAEERLAQRPGSSLLSVMSRVELEGGVYKDLAEAEVRRLRLDQMLLSVEVLAFGPAEADVYGEIVAACGFSRVRTLDRMIAATAITAGATLATLNPRDFRDIPGPQMEDWSA
jgi:predicted nucleic acid-binding protein